MKKSTIFIAFLLMILLFILWIIVSCSYTPEEEPNEITEIQTVVLPKPDIAEPEPEPNVMEVTATAYCPCKECSDEWGNKTSTGAIAKAGRTIAVDPKVIPYGTEVIIDGNTYVAEDTGGDIKGNMIDIYFDTHEETILWGRRKIEITT